MPAPQYVIRSYGGGADVAQLVNSMGATDTTFTISPTTGWMEDDGNPLGTSGPFTVVIDRFTASVEKILCSAVNLSTGVVTVYVDNADGWSGRGYDGTTPQAHVPGGSSSGVQTCWSSAEAQEANLAVFDILGGGSESLVGVPIGTSVDFRGTPLTVPTNFLFENGAAVSRTSYSALFTAITVQTTGTTTNASASITGVPTGITQYLTAGMQVTLTNSGGAIYTISSVGSTTITLNTGSGVTAGTAGGIIIYPHGAGDGSTTFNLPDSQGRATVGQGQVGSNAQPTMYVGKTGGDQTVTISQSNLPTTIGTAAAQSATVHDSGHSHQPAGGVTSFIETAGTSSLYLPTSGSQAASFVGTTTTVTTGVTVTNSTSAVTNSGGGSALNVESPYSVATKIIRVQ